ncbi:protein immune deficiency isoform X2 [Odontomachus brunneus]|uniref:protein immune deficiency isoform X2 n=1 Tax=Odontomachus brunneus TaxID=486640 RepID=UPI0013F20D2D|nr:protein immune deficiency isoform X2 [Odontomachus brunneus]
MITSARSVDLRERSSFLDGKARRALKKMPILSELSRRFQMLTTDAKPDPPRTGIPSYTHNLPPTEDEETKKRSKSMPTTQNELHAHRNDKDDDGVDVTASMRRQKSVPNDATPTRDFCAKAEDLGHTGPTNESKEYKRSRTRTKAKHAQGTNVVNYNIVNSNGVKIGSRTSYICNVNHYATNNNTTAQSEASWSKPKHRPMSPNVEELSACDEELAFDDMITIKTHVGHGWRDVARRLSYSDGQIEQFEENYRHNGIDEVIYQLLLDWKQANTQDARLGTLISALWSCQEYDCVERLVATRKVPS